MAIQRVHICYLAEALDVELVGAGHGLGGKLVVGRQGPTTALPPDLRIDK